MINYNYLIHIKIKSNTAILLHSYYFVFLNLNQISLILSLASNVIGLNYLNIDTYIILNECVYLK